MMDNDRDYAEEIELAIRHLLMLLDAGKPNDRSELDRLWAIVRTDAQKLQALWFYFNPPSQN